VVIHPQNNATVFQLLCLCCRYDLGTCVNQNGGDIGMFDCEKRKFLENYKSFLSDIVFSLTFDN